MSGIPKDARNLDIMAPSFQAGPGASVAWTNPIC
jgi:hypothetical protein